MNKLTKENFTTVANESALSQEPKTLPFTCKTLKGKRKKEKTQVNNWIILNCSQFWLFLKPPLHRKIKKQQQQHEQGVWGLKSKEILIETLNSKKKKLLDTFDLECEKYKNE